MEFWGVEVKSGEPLSVKPGDGMVLHLSQANLGEVKKLHGSESVCLFVNVDGKKLVLGTLISDKLPQQQFDLIFDKDFELSHNWKNGNVYFYGFKVQNPIADDDDDQESDSDEDSPLKYFKEPETNVKPEKQAGSEKSDVAKSSGTDKKVKIKEPHKDVKAKEDESSDEDMGSSDDDDLSDEDMDSSDGEDEDESDSEDESDETPKKVESSKERPAESGKKRLAESVKKTPASDKNKKAKTETPQKTGGKKSSVHVATPYPLKQAKTAANKPNQLTPKSAGSHTCKSCNRTFGSEVALDSHTKAKHSSGK